jgi:hypothetical protein
MYDLCSDRVASVYDFCSERVLVIPALRGSGENAMVTMLEPGAYAPPNEALEPKLLGMHFLKTVDQFQRESARNDSMPLVSRSFKRKLTVEMNLVLGQG